MARIQEYFQLGDKSNLTIEHLAILIEDMYKTLAVAVNQKPDIIVRQTDGVSTEVIYEDGTLNLNQSTNIVQILAEHASQTTVNWVNI